MASADDSILGEKYRLIRQLDEGAMGSVWLAEHMSLHSPVAIKLMAPEVLDTEDGVERFFREARTAAALRTPHVVQILDYGVQQGVPYIVMELLDGEPLSERLQRVRRLSLKETEHVLRHVSRALSRTHDAGIVHRDLKPANVFIVRNEDEELVKLLDFGIAKARVDVLGASMANSTRTGVFLGTPCYMSPEQVEGKKSLDFRADIWGMGILAYECLLGALPFGGDTFGSLVLSICARPLPIPSERGPVPTGFDAWFSRACARDPAERFQSAREAAAELRRLTENAPEAGKPGPGERANPADRLPSVSLAGTAGGFSQYTSRRPGKWQGQRWALAGTAVFGIGVLFFALRPSPKSSAAIPIRSAAAEASDPNAKTGVQVMGEGGPLTLFVDGARIGLLPRLVELTPGAHVIVVSGGPRATDHEERVFVKPGRITRVGPIKLKEKHDLAMIRAGNEAAAAAGIPLPVPQEPSPEAHATLNVDSNPSSRVLLDGKLLGVTPIADIAVEPGTHEVVFIHGVESHVQSITLAAGKSGNLQVDF